MSFTRIFKTGIFSALFLAGLTNANAANFKIDTDGMHGFIEFKVSHMGFSVLGGRFDKFEGTFTWDKNNPAASSAEVTIQTASIDTNHAQRDQHLSSPDFLNVAKFPTATFKSTKFEGDAKGGKLSGNFTLNGVTKPIVIDVKAIGEGTDFKQAYRAGFTGSTVLNGADYGYTSQMFPKTIDLALSVEGIQQK